MICGVLHQAEQEKPSRVFPSRHDVFETVVGKRPKPVDQAKSGLLQVLYGLVPCTRIRLRHTPVLSGGQNGHGLTVESCDCEPDPAFEMEHDLMDSVAAREGTAVSGFRVHVGEEFEKSVPMPCGAGE